MSSTTAPKKRVNVRTHLEQADAIAATLLALPRESVPESVFSLAKAYRYIRESERTKREAKENSNKQWLEKQNAHLYAKQKK